MFEGCIAARDHDVGGRFAVLVGQGEAVTGGRNAGQRGGVTAVGDVADHAAIHQREAAARDAFAVEGRAGLQRVAGVVVDGDVFAEKLFADAVVEEAAAVADGGGAEIAEHLAQARSSTAAGSRITV